jgi:hypothetical protein
MTEGVARCERCQANCSYSQLMDCARCAVIVCPSCGQWKSLGPGGAASWTGTDPTSVEDPLVTKLWYCLDCYKMVSY